MSSPFPLAPFLESLASDGICASLDDYERIALTLRCGGAWNKERLRGVLLSLLIRDEDLEAIFRKRFVEFFDLSDQQTEVFSDVDIERALDDLRRLAGWRQPQRKRPRSDWQRIAPRIEKSWQRMALLALLLAMLLTLAFILWFVPKSSAPQVVPRVEFNIQNLVFGDQQLNSKTVREIELTNYTEIPLDIENIRLTGFANKDYTLWASPCLQEALASEASCRISVAFTPQMEGLRSAFLEVVISGESITTAGLRGIGAASPKPEPQHFRVYPDFPYVRERRDLPRDGRYAWLRPAAMSALFLLAVLGYGAWLRLWRRPPPDLAPPWDAGRPRLFRPGTIGAAPKPWLDRKVLDQVAESLGYFRSDLEGNRLDIPASVRATAEGGGAPGMVFKRRRQGRRVIILEDTFAELRTFNPIASELAAGLARRGVPVVHGLFRGVPASFCTTDGSLFHLEDLEDDRRGYLVLVFSDGKGIQLQRDAFALEVLSRWPNVAWLELRERRGWDESTALVARRGLPIFAATQEGLLAMMECYATERAPQLDFTNRRERWDGLPVWAPGTTLAQYVERLLGDSLAWAQSCAMAMPPVSLGLADALRQQFFSELPPERIERLLALPRSSVNAAGLELSKEVLAVLRTGFAARLSRRSRQRILEFLLGEIRKAEPKDVKSLEHQAWAWRYERVRLELEPDAALEILSKLGRGPLGSSIRAELAEVVLHSKEGVDADDDGGIPLLKEPETRRGWQRLSILAPGAGVPRQKVCPPVEIGHWTVMVVLGLGVLGSLGMTIQAFFVASQPSVRITNSVIPWNNLILEVKEGEGWRELSNPILGRSASSLDAQLALGKEYRLSMHLNGVSDYYDLGSVAQKSLIDLETLEHRLPCRKEYQSIGLTVERCPPMSANLVTISSWRHLLGDAMIPSRFMSVGLEISNGESDAARFEYWREVLWASQSVDVVYSIAPAEDGELHLEEALARIKAELGPWQQASQLIFWGPEAEALGRSPWGRVLALGPRTEWVPRLTDLLAPSDDPVVSEADVLAVLASVPVSVFGPEPLIALVRPESAASVASVDVPVASPGSAAESGTPDNQNGGTQSVLVVSNDTSSRIDVPNTSDTLEDLTLMGQPVNSVKITSGKELPEVRAGDQYFHQLRTAGGSNDVFRWTVLNSELPTGLDLDQETGALTGYPTQSGKFTIGIVDGFGNTLDFKTFSITVKDWIRIETRSLPDATVGERYEIQLSAATGKGFPVHWRLEDTIGLGLFMDETGRIKGTPTQPGILELLVKATTEVEVEKLFSIAVWDEFEISAKTDLLGAISLGLESLNPVPDASSAAGAVWQVAHNGTEVEWKTDAPYTKQTTGAGPWLYTFSNSVTMARYAISFSLPEGAFQVIVNAGNPTASLPLKTIHKMFVKRQSRWPDGSLVYPINILLLGNGKYLDDYSILKHFFSTVHGRSISGLKFYWHRQIFSGNDTPPEEARSEQEIMSFVAGRLGAIGYVGRSTELIEGVKGLLVER